MLTTVESHHLIYWLLIGLISGAIASRVVSGRGMGCLVDTVVGLAGAFIGGYVFSQVSPRQVVISGTFDELLVSFIGAVLLLLVVRLVTGKRRGS